MTSDSANTVQVLLTTTFSVLRASYSPICSTLSSSTRAMLSMKRPVPAAHLSFMKKHWTAPFSSMEMALQSCPPMSRMVRAVGKRKWTPLLWQLISLTALSAMSSE